MEMIPILAKVLTVDRLGDQFLITVRVEPEKIEGTVDRLGFGKIEPQIVTYHNGWLDLVYYQNPGLKAGKSFPLWKIH